jgi:hypothetical protein
MHNAPLLRFSGSILAFSACIPPCGAQPPPGVEWVPTLAEEFDESTLDRGFWATPTETGLFDIGAGDPSQLLLSDGALHLVTRYHPKSGREWSSASVSTRRFHQAFGYFEVRLRYARATGLTDLVKLVTDLPPSLGGTEITLVEGRYPNQAIARLRTTDHSENGPMPAPADLSADYHLFGLSWLPDGNGAATLTWYLDDHPVFHASCPNCTHPARVWLGTEVTTWRGPFAPATGGSAMDVDYVRIYQMPNLLGR